MLMFTKPHEQKLDEIRSAFEFLSGRKIQKISLRKEDYSWNCEWRKNFILDECGQNIEDACARALDDRDRNRILANKLIIAEKMVKLEKYQKDQTHADQANDFGHICAGLSVICVLIGLFR